MAKRSFFGGKVVPCVMHRVSLSCSDCMKNANMPTCVRKEGSMEAAYQTCMKNSNVCS